MARIIAVLDGDKSADFTALIGADFDKSAPVAVRLRTNNFQPRAMQAGNVQMEMTGLQLLVEQAQRIRIA